MKTKIHANIGIEIEFNKFINPYFSNIHSIMAYFGLFASYLITLHILTTYNNGRGYKN